MSHTDHAVDMSVSSKTITVSFIIIEIMTLLRSAQSIGVETLSYIHIYIYI